MRRRTILFVIENESFGGGERAFAELINGLDKGRFRACAACLGPSAGPGSEPFAARVRESAELFDFDMRRRFDPRLIGRLEVLIKESGADIVHSQGARADLFARMALRSGRPPILISTLAVPVEEYDVGPLKKAAYVALDRVGEERVDRFITVAEHLRRKLIERRSIAPEKISLIRNGVEPAAFAAGPESAAAVRRELGAGADDHLIGAVGRLSPVKNLPCLIDAAARLMREAPGLAGRVKLIIAGEGEAERELRESARELGIEDRVSFVGFKKDVRPILNALDILALPSQREGFPMIVLEAMAAGKPVVASDIDGVRESVEDGVTGILCPVGVPGPLARALGELAADRARAKAMGAAGRKAVAERFTLAKMVRAHEAVYDELLGGGKG